MDEGLIIGGEETGLFEQLTAKQRQTMDLLAEGWTSKEIAHKLGISESAVVQRIEALRTKTGGLLRKDLARSYRLYLDNLPPTCKEITSKNFHLPSACDPHNTPLWNFSGADLELADAATFDMSPPWSSRPEPRVVPEVLDGKDASLYRWFVAILMALALVILMLVLVTVAGEISDLV